MSQQIKGFATRNSGQFGCPVKSQHLKAGSHPLRQHYLATKRGPDNPENRKKYLARFPFFDAERSTDAA